MSTERPLVELGRAPTEIIDGDRGTHYPGQNELFEEGHCLFLSATNVTASGFKFDSCQFIDEQKDRVLRKGKLKRKDIVMTTRGTLGNIAYYSDDVPFEDVRINSGMVIFRAVDVLLRPEYLYYALRSTGTAQQINTLRSGAAQPQLPIRDIRKIRIPLPEPKLQDDVLFVIKPYDDLIDNNNRRIELLERSARLLFEEWFVRVRYPGHEKDKVVDGVPEGWQKRKLADLCVSIDYGYTASAQRDRVGPKYLRITDIVPSAIHWDSVPYCEIDTSKIERYSLREGDLVIARTGTTVGYAKRLHKRHPDSVFASYLVRLRLKPEVDNLLVGVFVESDQYKSFVRSRVGGAAQPNANAKVLASAELLIPTHELQMAYREFAEPLIDQRELLNDLNARLANARDLLLPRLMDGRIEV